MLSGVVVYEYELKIGWGKSVALPSQALPAPPPGHMAIRSTEVNLLIREADFGSYHSTLTIPPSLELLELSFSVVSPNLMYRVALLSCLVQAPLWHLSQIKTLSWYVIFCDSIFSFDLVFFTLKRTSEQFLSMMIPLEHVLLIIGLGLVHHYFLSQKRNFVGLSSYI